MPGIYRLKHCPLCGEEHRKRGEYCSRSCGNKRKPTTEHKQKIGDANRRHMAGDSESAEKSKWLITQQRRGDGKTSEELYREMEEYGVVPPDDIGYSYLKDTNGDIWT